MILPPLVLVNGQKWVYSFAKELNKTQKQCNNDTFSWTKIFAGGFGGPRNDEDEDNQDLDIEELMTGDVHDMEWTSLVHWLWTIFVTVQFWKYKNHDPDPKSAMIFFGDLKIF